MTLNPAQLKDLAAAKALEYVESGMILGLGTGSTATAMVRRLGPMLARGELKNIIGVPTSLAIAAEAEACQIPLTDLAAHPKVDLTIDGADEVDPALNLIKGGGGALLREKIVAQASAREIIVVDESKLVDKLGRGWALPVETIPFGLATHYDFIASLGGKAELRLKQDGQPFVSDQGNHILDCNFGPMDDPAGLAARLDGRVGLVEHGLFIGLAQVVVVAGADGVRVLEKA